MCINNRASIRNLELNNRNYDMNKSVCCARRNNYILYFLLRKEIMIIFITRLFSFFNACFFVKKN